MSCECDHHCSRVLAGIADAGAELHDLLASRVQEIQILGTSRMSNGLRGKQFMKMLGLTRLTLAIH